MRVNDFNSASFYDEMAADYALLFGNWEKTIHHHGKILSQFLATLGKDTSHSILDCSCGTGLQLLGLAIEGYNVTGTDISSKSLAVAKKQARELGVKVSLHVADMRLLPLSFSKTFDVVLACGSLPHLLQKNDLNKCLRSIHSVLSPGGFFIGAMRDYDSLLNSRPSHMPLAHYPKGSKYKYGLEILNWQPHNSIYEALYIHLSAIGDQYNSFCRKLVCRAYRRDEISDQLKKNGFVKIKWHMPSETGYFQPIVTAKIKS